MISLCITNFERTDLLFASFMEVIDDDRIGEIVISDDHSSEKVFLCIQDFCKDKPKIKLFRNDSNIGMSLNKTEAILLAKCEWCILFDSDNILTKQYLNALFKREWYNKVIYAPVSGGPHLDYTRFSNWFVSKSNINHFLSFPKAEMLLNTCNYFVNRQEYLRAYDFNKEIQASDTIWFNYLWLKSGGSFIIVPDMAYMHRIHPGSGFMQNVEYNTKMFDMVLTKIKQL